MERTSTQLRDLIVSYFGSWRLVSRNDETSHESEVRMRDSAEKLCCISRVSLQSWRRHAWQIQIKTHKGSMTAVASLGGACRNCLTCGANTMRINKPILCACATLLPTMRIKVRFSIPLLSFRGTHCGNGLLGDHFLLDTGTGIVPACMFCPVKKACAGEGCSGSRR